jgi:hypothetical protein
MPSITADARFRRRNDRSAKHVSAEIKARITIPILAEKLCPGWKPSTQCLSPFRDEKKASFSVYADGRKWKDFTTDEGGDLFDFYRKAEGCTDKQAFLALKSMLDGGTIGAAPIIRAAARPEGEKKQYHPDLFKLRDNDLAELSRLRSIAVDALQIAVDRGLLYGSVLKGRKAFVVTDRTRKSYNARRLDGKPWEHLPSTSKAWLLWGSNGNWSIGIQEAADFQAIALCEGGPDFLSAFAHAYASGVENLVAPVCMSGASGRIAADALSFFKDKRVRVFVHDDRAGYDAGERWAKQLSGIASKVDGFAFGGLTDVDGSSIGDLNQLLRVDCDCWEANRETIEGVMSFALEGEQQ